MFFAVYYFGYRSPWKSVALAITFLQDNLIGLFVVRRMNSDFCFFEIGDAQSTMNLIGYSQANKDVVKNGVWFSLFGSVALIDFETL